MKLNTASSVIFDNFILWFFRSSIGPHVKSASRGLSENRKNMKRIEEDVL
jgi:hypothetical protein